MSTRVSIYEAKAHLSRLVVRAEHGEEITLTRHGRSVAVLSAVRRPDADRTPGAWAGRVRVAEDFDSLTDDDLRDWYGA
ncbi:type II toxin-antitoxin system Phd/YefM family antitoxin [Isoptericola sp. BMS4]|uniref:type II toxin-antitoxin system Phd/YefM family antitoxin n=1 Tax=Isoptericola sp. BMS4 TaxID=2527875 RepID=UPI0014215CB4|nr:type II toxin-antitoxin system prevent-host-death family antitoxin [Isoptericola sp. BMS4]